MAAKKKAEVAQEAQADTPAEGRSRGYDALTPNEKFSVDQVNPYGNYGPGLSRGPGQTAEEVASHGEREGSVLPYKVDDIDVDSLDTRSAEEIAAEKKAEEGDDKA